MYFLTHNHSKNGFYEEFYKNSIINIKNVKLSNQDHFSFISFFTYLCNLILGKDAKVTWLYNVSKLFKKEYGDFSSKNAFKILLENKNLKVRKKFNIIFSDWVSQKVNFTSFK